VTDGPDHNDFVTEWDALASRPRASTRQSARVPRDHRLHWLGLEPERFDDVPGVWRRDAKGVEVLLGDGESSSSKAPRVTGHYHFNTSTSTGNRASFGDAMVEVAQRDGDFMIRPRSPRSRKSHSLRRYSDVPRKHRMGRPWNIPSYDEPHSVTVGASVEGLAHVFESSGEVEFELFGTDLRLIAFNEEQSDELSFIFTDLTSGVTTYPACRFPHVSVRERTEESDLDFNRATNPACAYTISRRAHYLRRKTTYHGVEPAKRCP